MRLLLCIRLVLRACNRHHCVHCVVQHWCGHKPSKDARCLCSSLPSLGLYRSKSGLPGRWEQVHSLTIARSLSKSRFHTSHRFAAVKRSACRLSRSSALCVGLQPQFEALQGPRHGRMSRCAKSDESSVEPGAARVVGPPELHIPGFSSGNQSGCYSPLSEGWPGGRSRVDTSRMVATGTAERSVQVHSFCLSLLIQASHQSSGPASLRCHAFAARLIQLVPTANLPPTAHFRTSTGRHASCSRRCPVPFRVAPPSLTPQSVPCSRRKSRRAPAQRPVTGRRPPTTPSPFLMPL